MRPTPCMAARELKRLRQQRMSQAECADMATTQAWCLGLSRSAPHDPHVHESAAVAYTGLPFHALQDYWLQELDSHASSVEAVKLVVGNKVDMVRRGGWRLIRTGGCGYGQMGSGINEDRWMWVWARPTGYGPG